MQKVAKFTDLVAWQESHSLAVDVYKMTKQFPDSEIFGLTNQIRRAAVSVSSNIAEGFSRPTKADKLHFYAIAQGSLTEVQSQMMLARDIGYLPNTEMQRLAEKSVTSHKLITGLIKSLKDGKGVK